MPASLLTSCSRTVGWRSIDLFSIEERVLQPLSMTYSPAAIKCFEPDVTLQLVDCS